MIHNLSRRLSGTDSAGMRRFRYRFRCRFRFGCATGTRRYTEVDMGTITNTDRLTTHKHKHEEAIPCFDIYYARAPGGQGNMMLLRELRMHGIDNLAVHK